MKLGIVLSRLAITGLLALGTTAQGAVIGVTEFVSNPSASPGQWGISDVRPGGTATIEDLTGLGGDLENNQPLPANGAALLTTDSTNAAKAEVGIYRNYGTFGDIVSSIALGYDFLKDSSGISAAPAPAMKLGLFNGSVLGYLIYEPYVNPAYVNPTPDVWTSESMDATTGGWWWSGAFGPGSSFGGPPYNTLSAWASNAALANASLVYVGIGMGTYNPNTVGYFDNVQITAGAFSDTYDFQVAAPVPEPSSLALLVMGGLGLAVRARRSKNAKGESAV